MSERESVLEFGTEQSRRQFLGAFGSGLVATAAVSGTVTARETPTVSVGNNYFDPVGLAVEPGTTVRFEIDAGSHSVTAYENRVPSDTTPFDSGTISEGAFEYTFDTPGTYDYYCLPHKSMGMTGRIVVSEPGGPAEATPIPDGDVSESDAIVTQGRVSGGSEGSGMGGDGHMGESQPPMMTRDSHGWRMLVPAGFFTTALGVVGGLGYWLSRQHSRKPAEEDHARASLKREYARGDIDDEEFESQLEQLSTDEQ
jgi:plastocyanin/uncharacterized membrane protein